MALLLKNGAVFLHVPKTGGLWVTEVLEELGLVERRIEHIHADAQRVLRYLEGRKTLVQDVLLQAKSRLPLGLKKRVRKAVVAPRGVEVDRTPFMFCFVRDPLEWYASYWRYQSDMEWLEYGNRYDVHDWHPWTPLNGLGSPDFDEFIRNVIATRPGYLTEMFGWYTTPAVNFVGRTERLADDLIDVLGRLGVSFDEERVRTWKPKNTSSRGPGRRASWTPELRREMERIEYAARLRFGYIDPTADVPSTRAR